MPAERHFRAFARRAVSLPATVATASQSTSPARLVDLGLGGACVELSTPLAVDGRVTLEVTAPNLWDPLLVPASVAWVKTAGPEAVRAGLAFDHERPHALPALLELLAAYRYE